MWRDFIIAAFTILGSLGSGIILYLVKRLDKRFDDFQAQIVNCRERLAALEALAHEWNGEDRRH